MRVEEGSQTHLMINYPLCYKYRAPCNFTPDRGWRFTKDVGQANDWLRKFPFGAYFWNTMGQVTCDEGGYYLCDIEDTLYALEQGRKQRGGF